MTGAIAKGLSVEASLRAWNYLVRSVLEYGAKVTGYCQWPEAEYIQNEVGRRILGVIKSCSTLAVRGELGWWTLNARRELLMLRFWGKIVAKRDDSLIKRIYRHRKMSQPIKGSWCYSIRKVLNDLGLGESWESENIGSVQGWAKRVEKKIKDREVVTWLIAVQGTSKLRTYRRIKANLGLEEYLSDIPIRSRRLISQIRCGSSFLRIEQGRWEKLSREDRKCLVCVTGKVEDEKHFLLECYVYQRDRQTMFEVIREKTSKGYDLERWRDDPLRMLDALIGRNVGDENVIMNEVGLFIMKSYKLRKSFLDMDPEEVSVIRRD